MNKGLPKSLLRLVDAFSALPGVGPRTAERYAYYLLKTNPDKAKYLSETAGVLHESVKQCPMTFAYIEKDQDYSPLYTDPKRDKTIIAVVAEPFDILALEKTNSFKGTYHVLGGLISPIDGVGPDQLHIDSLAKRISKDSVHELILAINASVEGETTALYIQQKLSGSKIKITRLARGLPIGIDLEYADQITLSRAIEGRQELI